MMYCAGFLFDGKQERVALILKEKPDWQKGKWNGIGGKVKDNEKAADAMKREFREEAGADVLGWREFFTLHFKGGTVLFFTATGDYDIKTMESEKVEWHQLGQGGQVDARIQTIPNLRWLIPMALDKFHISAIGEETA